MFAAPFGLLVLASALPTVTHVEAVRVEGTWVSREATVLRELVFSAPGEVTPEEWALSEHRLWNLGIFSQVALELEQVEGRSVAVVRVQDRFPLSPIFRFSLGGGQFFLWAGATNINTAGTAIELRALYERFGPYNGFAASATDPRFAGKRVSVSVEGEWLFRPRPEFTGRRATVRLRTEWTPTAFPDDTLRPQLQLEGSSDDFPYASTDPIELVASKALSFSAGLQLGRIDTNRLLQSGWSLTPRVSVGVTSDVHSPGFLRGDLVGLGYFVFAERFNLAARLQAGSTAGARVQDRFYIGGLDLVRGYQDSEVRAELWLVVNLELRLVAFDSTWFAVMPIVFTDGAVARRDNLAVATLFSSGVGLRLMVPRLPRFGVRVDGSLPWISTDRTTALHPALNLGIWQFF